MSQDLEKNKINTDSDGAQRQGSIGTQPITRSVLQPITKSVLQPKILNMNQTFMFQEKTKSIDDIGIDSESLNDETTQNLDLQAKAVSYVEYYINNAGAVIRDAQKPNKAATPYGNIRMGTKVVIISNIENTPYVKVRSAYNEEAPEQITSFVNLTKVEKYTDGKVYRGVSNSTDTFDDPFSTTKCGKITMQDYFIIKEKCGTKVHIYLEKMPNVEHGWIDPAKLLLKPKDISNDYSFFQSVSDWTTLEKVDEKQLADIEANRNNINDRTDSKTYGNTAADKLNVIYNKKGEMTGTQYLGKNIHTPDINGQSPLDTQIQKSINKESEKEGGFSSINTWDGESFTYGRGLASGGSLIKVLKDFLNKDTSYVAMFNGAGIAIVGNTLMVVGKDGIVYKGANAATQIASDTRLLSFFIEIGENKDSSKDMMESEYKELSSTLACPDYCIDKKAGTYKDNWTESSITILAHLTHWAGKGWDELNYSDTKGDLNKIIYKYIYNTCLDYKGMRKSYPDSNYIWDLQYALPSRLSQFGVPTAGAGYAAFVNTWGDDFTKEIIIEKDTNRIQIKGETKYLKNAILFKVGDKYRIIVPVGETLESHLV